MTTAWRQQWQEQGYLIVPGVFSRARTEQLRVIAERIWTQFRRLDPLTRKPGGGLADPNSLRHLNHPDYHAGDPASFQAVMDAAADDLVLGIARAILDEPPLFRCTTLWYQPAHRHDDGQWHRDLQFMYPKEAEERAAFDAALRAAVSGIQLQIPLIPSADVEYVPGSHLRWDTPAEYAIRAADGRKHSASNAMPGALRVALEPGDAVLFNANGLHRGRYHADIPRCTLMLTYTQTSHPLTDYFTDQPWFLNPGHLDPLPPRTRAFFEPFIAQYRAQWTAPQPEPALAY